MFRLAIFTDTYDDVNGVAVLYRQMVRTAEGGPSTPAHVSVFCLSDRTDAETGRHSAVYRYRPRPRIPVPRYPELHTGFIPVRQIGLDFGRAAPDAVVVATPGPIGFLGQRLARRAGLPLIGFYHTRFPVYLAVYMDGIIPTRRGPRHVEALGFRWMRLLYGACDLVIGQSEAIAAEVRRATLAPLAVWDTGVDTALFRPGQAAGFRERYGIATDAQVVAYVGRLAAEKNLDHLAAVSHRLPELHFLIVGDGPYAPTLRRSARATFTGYLQGEELATAFRAGDIFLFPSTTDTFGIVLLEAMASGLPVVVAAEGPPAELVRRTEAGLAYPPGDLDAMAASLARLASDGPMRTVMGHRARAHAETCGWSSALARFVALCRGARSAA